MALDKAELLALIEADCEQQGTVSVPGPILKELVENYIPVISLETAIADVVPGTVTNEQLGDAVNAILAVMRTNKLIAT